LVAIYFAVFCFLYCVTLSVSYTASILISNNQKQFCFMKTLTHLLWLVVVSIGLTTSMFAQCVLDLSTGVDAAGNSLSIGDNDLHWVVTHTPVTSVNLNVPRVSYVVDGSIWDTPSWDNTNYCGNSQWISPETDNDWSINNPYDPYILEYCFCTSATGKININLAFLADDVATIELHASDGTVTPLPINAYFPNPDPHPYNFIGYNIVNSTISVPQGNHCLVANLENTHGIVMGYRACGTVSGDFLICNEEVCAGVGMIYGYKYQDASPNGAGGLDVALPNWTIFLYQNGALVATTTTDASGYYVFPNLSAGNYVVVENTPNGWSATTPAAVNVSLASGQFVQQDFYNRRVTCTPPTGEITFSSTHICVGDEGWFEFNGTPQYLDYAVFINGTLSEFSGNLGASGVHQDFVASLSDVGTYELCLLVAKSLIVNEEQGIVIGNGCVDTTCITVVIEECKDSCGSVIADFEYALNGNNVDLTNTSTSSYDYLEWIVDGQSYFDIDNNHSAPLNGTGQHELCLVIVKTFEEEHLCCRDTMCVDIAVDTCDIINFNASFTVASISGNTVILDNTSSPAPTVSIWTVNGQSFIDNTGDDFTYIFPGDGVYPVCLKAIRHLDAAGTLCCIDVFCDTIVIRNGNACDCIDVKMDYEMLLCSEWGGIPDDCIYNFYGDVSNYHCDNISQMLQTRWELNGQVVGHGNTLLNYSVSLWGRVEMCYIVPYVVNGVVCEEKTCVVLFDNTMLIAITPNPVKNIATLSLGTNLQVREVTLLNSQGKVLQTIPTNGTSAQINMEAYDKGVYFVQGIDEISGNIVAEKLIKM
jgi:hypothetical protein